jgi:cardiolipin synthase
MLYVINFVLALFLIFYMEKDASVTWAWLLILLFLPILGFLLFLLFGYGLKNKEKDVIKNTNDTTLKELNSFLSKNKKVYDESEEVFLNSLNHLPVSTKNEISIITDGQEKLNLLKRDLKNATKFIYIQYYAFLTDKTGISILEILEKQAEKGVSVKLLYDKLGSKGVKKELFTPLIKAGGEVSTFLTSQNAVINFGMNYHNHRKIVVIDDDISYIGGFNIADQYVEETKHFGYWRDTHMRMIGPGSHLLKYQFIVDWNVSVSKDKLLSYSYLKEREQPFIFKGKSKVQIISSGPNDEKQQIKLAFVKLIMSAKKRIWIQTPYLIPDDTIIDALEIAKRSGVDVRIMVPDKPDHPFIYRATQFFSTVLVKKGISIYTYHNGFLHSKVLIVDDEISIVGSANQDIRSYKLNFETSVIIFDLDVNQKLSKSFQTDQLLSEELTMNTIKKMSAITVFKQKLFRLFSPIM